MQVVVADEFGSSAEAAAVRGIAQKGVAMWALIMALTSESQPTCQPRPELPYRGRAPSHFE